MPEIRTLFLLAATAAPALAQDSRSEAFDVPRREGARYHLIDARGEAPRSGAGLLVVLPGGAGGADFLPFVENGILAAAPADFVGAMVPAVRWSDDQQVVWPTERDPVPKMEYSTEDLVLSVVEDVKRRRKIDPDRVLLLVWSSSGPPAYELALQKKTPFSGFYVAMSVFKPKPSALRHAKGRRFVLDQSPEDRVTPMRFATAAKDALSEAGATVWLRSYPGGHGWHDSPFVRLRSGLRWLVSAEPAPAGDGGAGEAVAEGDNLLRNGGFENGTNGWLVLNDSETTSCGADRDVKREGAQSMCIAKTGAMPVDVLRQEVELEGGTKVQVSAQVRCRGARNAFLKFFVYGDGEKALNEDVDLVHLRGDRDWEAVARTFELPKEARRGVLMLVMVLDGEVWLDDARVVAVR